MKVEVLIFGQLTDITGLPKIVVEDVRDTKQFMERMHELYPALNDATYIIAVNKNIISENTILENNNIIALLPPFSGG